MKVGAYGKDLSDIFRLDIAPSFVSRALRHSTVAVTQIICDIENNGLTAPLVREDAFLVTLQLRHCPAHELWIDGKAMQTGYLAPGAVSVYDLRTNPRVNSISPFHNMHFYFTRAALVAAADGEDPSYLDSMSDSAGTGAYDPVIFGLGRSLLPAFERPGEASALFVNHVTTATAAYVAGSFGGVRAMPVPCALAPWQEQRAKELLRASLDGVVSIATLAAECGLPAAIFSEAFRRVTGVPPHRWLLEQRVERARALLRTHRAPSDVAAACGFLDSDHLQRVLAKPPR